MAITEAAPVWLRPWRNFITTRLHRVEERLLYAPVREMIAYPSDAGLPYEIVFLPTLPSGCIQGWYIPARDPNAPLLLYCHGNAGNISCHVNLGYFFRYLGMAVFLFDYQGYGQSQGRPSETALYADAQTVWQHLTRERGLSPERILLWGHSLGGAVAMELALWYPQVQGLILEGAFTSIPEMGRLNPFFRPLPLDRLVRDRFDNRTRVGRLQVPLVVIHGTADDVVPYTMGEALYTGAPGFKRLCTVPNGGHNKLWATLGVARVRELIAWMQDPTPDQP
ncbi:alpha/beta hydrolase [Anthocerotibacter panamensis]|uniref:alpha/beta hydrolase n=1 Tax=Anthocerotibacter panamensis TaxID=2857077 RepID=UPI001C406840|nr:alpha/beta fold hydrolase [Anthocerotibacter panamensis]